MMFGESSKALNSSAPKLVISNRMSIHFSVRFRGACPIKFDYLQFDFSACSSSDDEKENERSHKSVFRGVKWFQSNRVFFLLFRVRYAFTICSSTRYLMRSGNTFASIAPTWRAFSTWLRFEVSFTLYRFGVVVGHKYDSISEESLRNQVSRRVAHLSVINQSDVLALIC